jgi:hypothetical protein
MARHQLLVLQLGHVGRHVGGDFGGDFGGDLGILLPLLPDLGRLPLPLRLQFLVEGRPLDVTLPRYPQRERHLVRLRGGLDLLHVRVGWGAHAGR